MVSQTEIKQVILDILQSNNAITIATTGGEYSPWVLGAYFASNDLTIYLMLEVAGKTMANLRKNQSVAIQISQNDAMKDFLQAYGTATVLPESEREKVMGMLQTKMPWYQLYTPCLPVRLDMKKWFVTSLSRQWLPARVLEAETVTAEP
ncbi:MAG: pyridoxamine 5'-phosphate oxidase family protein [Chloroherpetonaceae bacterium]|nr:pyridoxamine 5'-phosphate oxidase family protein [Chloroherpetonaceae bacterium]MDW8465099.1 pyridoxamine 5'-phosphate oxidase family protein [Chloroherpetonaceae bacterium]